jgi:hypothetical protein
MFYKTHAQKQVKLHKIKKKAQKRRHIFRNAQTKEKEESLPTHLHGPKHRHGGGPGLA